MLNTLLCIALVDGLIAKIRSWEEEKGMCFLFDGVSDITQETFKVRTSSHITFKQCKRECQVYVYV